jgi:hypothetical protein
LLLLSDSPVAASVYHYDVTGTFPSNTTTTYWSAPNQPFEYRFTLVPEILDRLGVHGRIFLPADISYFLRTQQVAQTSGLVRFSLEPTDVGGADRLFFPSPPTFEFPPFFNGWFPASHPLYSYTVLSVSPVEVLPTLYEGYFPAIKENGESQFVGATVGQWQISDAVVRVNFVPEASSLVSAGLGITPAIGLWAFRRRHRRA